MLYDVGSAFIYFGNSEDGLISKDSGCLSKDLDVLRKRLDFPQLVFLKQTHGVDGVLITDNGSVPVSFSNGLDDLNNYKQISRPVDVWSFSGDFIVSNKKKVGIGALTADCLPIVLLDFKNRISSIVHAGWRGSVQKRECCYEVQRDFVGDLSKKGVNSNLFVIKRGEKTFFDLVRFNKQQLYDYGILDNHIIDEHCLCTVCNGKFCSYRRDKDYGRQATVVMLN